MISLAKTEANCFGDAGLECPLAKQLISATQATPEHYLTVLRSPTKDDQDPDPAAKSNMERFLWNFLALRTSLGPGRRKDPSSEFCAPPNGPKQGPVSDLLVDVWVCLSTCRVCTWVETGTRGGGGEGGGGEGGADGGIHNRCLNDNEADDLKLLLMLQLSVVSVRSQEVRTELAASAAMQRRVSLSGV